MIRRLLLAVILVVPSLAVASDWEYVGKKDGVATWSQAIEGSKLLGFRGVGEVDVHVSRMVAAMLDPQHTTEWVDLLAEQRILHDDGETQVIYQRYAMNWPVADRDMVLHRTVRTIPEKNLTTIHLKSTTHPDAPLRPGVVRADVMKTYLAFTALPGGRTNVEVQAFTDPKGMVPQWLVNLVQKTWARNSINALTKIARRPHVKPFEPAQSWQPE